MRTKALNIRTSLLLGFFPILSLASTLMADDPKIAAVEKGVAEKPTAEGIHFFETKIRPLLHARCVECHNHENHESELRLDSYEGLLKGGKLGPAVTPGKPKESLLISAVNHDEFLKMPPKDKLATADLALLSKWVAMGAPWPESKASSDIRTLRTDTLQANKPMSVDLVEFTPEQKSFWAYQPLSRPKIIVSDLASSAVASSAVASLTEPEARSPIDAFVQKRLSEKGLRPARPLSRRDWIRRATYDLTGLPPDEEEIKNFVDDDSPDADNRVMDRLLASPHYGERWGRHWLDVARYADSNGLDENIAYANAFRYRDYVIASFNGDKRYDRFVQEQIAGDLLPPDPDNATGDPLDRFVGTGFLVIGAKMLAEDDPMKMQMDIIDEQLSTLCQAFMGITIGCARCHDHKFDPLPTSDYYALAGIFKSTQTMEHHKVVARWFERPIATESQLEAMRAADREIESIKASVTNLNQQSRERVTHEIRASVTEALMATVQYEQFAEQADQSLRTGLNQADKPYAVQAGYALIEAEGFHRGNAIRDLDNYGKDIGVIISEGKSNAEYDLEVEHGGRYAIELRYTAAERRPIRLLVDKKEVAASVAGETTGTWQPDGQAWFVVGLFDLTPGKHVLRFESKRVFPHVDKFALVYQSDKDWPFGNAPTSLSRSGVSLGISFPVLSLWRNYLSDLSKKRIEESADDGLFDIWLRYRDLKESTFQTAASAITAELDGDAPLANRIPPALRKSIQTAQPKSLQQVAEAYQVAVTQMVSEPSSKEPFGKSSPLMGPMKDIERFHSEDERDKGAEYQTKLAEADGRRPKVPMAMGVTESKPENLKIHLRGSHVVLGKVVERRFPHILVSTQQTPIRESSSGRLEFAQWMTKSDHPLTSRVIANRLWHWHFGRGIVPSVDNFGILGQKPTHPELLDWLASQLVEGDWSLKRLHRTMMLSQTYQMSAEDPSIHDEAASRDPSEVDPENELLWHFRRRRLTGEEIRDSIIAVGQGVDQTMYGSLMKTENHAYVNSTDTVGSVNYDNARRSVYLPVIRSGVFDVLQTLDFPDPSMIAGERQTSTVAPQALLMMNSDLVHEQSQFIAKQIVGASMGDAHRISDVYRRVLKRPPTVVEIVAAANFLKNAREQAEELQKKEDPSVEILVWQSLCRVLISSNEFSYVE